MKGFKDKDKKFHPIKESRGVRKSRDSSSKTQGIKMTSGVRKKSDSKNADGSVFKQIKVWKFDDAPPDLQEKIIEKNRDINVKYEDNFWADYDGIIYDKQTNIADYDVFNNYGKKYYDLDRGQYIQFPDLEIKDEKKLAEMLGIPESLRKKISFNFTSERENNTELEFYDEENGETIRDDDTYEDYIKYVNDEDRAFSTELSKSEFEKLQKAIEKWSDLMHDAWKSLRDNYEYQFTDEAIKETIEANDYTFNEDGEIENI